MVRKDRVAIRNQQIDERFNGLIKPNLGSRESILRAHNFACNLCKCETVRSQN